MGGERLGQSPTTKKEQARKTEPNGSGWEGSVSTRQEGGREAESGRVRRQCARGGFSKKKTATPMVAFFPTLLAPPCLLSSCLSFLPSFLPSFACVFWLPSPFLLWLVVVRFALAAVLRTTQSRLPPPPPPPPLPPLLLPLPLPLLCVCVCLPPLLFNVFRRLKVHQSLHTRGRWGEEQTGEKGKSDTQKNKKKRRRTRSPRRAPRRALQSVLAALPPPSLSLPLSAPRSFQTSREEDVRTRA